MSRPWGAERTANRGTDSAQTALAARCRVRFTAPLGLCCVMPRYLGIDYGTKRIGLAISDPDGRMASPLSIVPARSDLQGNARAVMAAAEGYEADEIVVGLPTNMDDTEGPQAKLTREFGRALGRVSGLPVHYWDERLSTFAADALIRPAEMTRMQRRRRRDAVAAQLILQAFLDARASGGT